MKNSNSIMKNLMTFNVNSLKPTIQGTRVIPTVLLMLLCVASSYAQSDEINTQIGTWGEQIKTILNAVVGVFSIAGGFRIFIQYMQGNEQAQKNFVRFIIGLAIFGLVALIANVFLPEVGNDVA